MIEQAEKKITAALDNLSNTVGKIGNSFAPVMTGCPPTGKEEGKSELSESGFDTLVAKTIARINDESKRISYFCDRSRV